jgi:hypothetical protein
MFSLLLGCAAFAGVPGFVGVSAIVFSTDVAGVSALVGVLAAASFTADPGVLCCYRAIEISNIGQVNSRNYRTI